jgi:phospholipid/cholesterol/gamma-HCH transport system substrate-binding protein
METRASYLVVGGFVLVSLIALVVMVIWLAGTKFDEEFTYYDILFEGSVTGLKSGNPVRYRGIPVGVVSDMGIDKDNVERVRVTIEVPNDTPIKEDAIASLEFQGITGVAYVQIEGGTQDAPLLRPQLGRPKPIIKSKPSQLQEVFDAAPEVLNRFIALLEQASVLLGTENQSNVSDTLQNITTFTNTLAENSGDVGSMISDSVKVINELRLASAEARAAVTDLRGLVGDVTDNIALITGEARTTMDDIRSLTSDLRDDAQNLSGRLDGTLTILDKEVQGLGGETKSTLSAVRQASEQLAKIIESNQGAVTDFTASGLYEFTQLLAESRILVSSLMRISSEIERDPARFLFGNAQQGLEVK